ncbi:MAG: hypothetical protein NT001_02530 [Candidatus Woesearchaeota archaeon]|nr:hypothetical protein [Candidatus Woesearchaeota archaeon]
MELESMVLYAMRNRTGVFAVGRGNFPAQEVLAELEKNLEGYYDLKGIGLIAPPLDILQRTPEKGVSCFTCKEAHGRITSDKTQIINIAYYGSGNRRMPLEMNADYPVSWSNSISQKFGVYFNLLTLEAGRKERDDFMEFARKMINLH